MSTRRGGTRLPGWAASLLRDFVIPCVAAASVVTLRDCRPDEVATYAKLLMDSLKPDGEFRDQERARKRGITLGNQECDAMSGISGLPRRSCAPPLRPCWPSWPPPGHAT